MGTPKPRPTAEPFAWPGSSRQEWEELMRRRHHARLSLILSSLPGVFSAGAASLGAAPPDAIHQAWIAFSGMLQAWWDERRELEDKRKAFWLAYQEDPWRLLSPVEEALRAPWE